MNNIKKFDLDFDQQALLEQANDLEGYSTFIDPKTDKPITGWQVKSVTSGYAQYLSDCFADLFKLTDTSPRFYRQYPGMTIPFHRDRGTRCSFNFILSSDPDPIIFINQRTRYTIALINTQNLHLVYTKTYRILFKISVFDKSFDQLAPLIPEKILLPFPYNKLS